MYAFTSYPPASESLSACLSDILALRETYQFDEAAYEAKKARIRQKRLLLEAAQINEDPREDILDTFDAPTGRTTSEDRAARRKKAALYLSLAVCAAFLAVHPATRVLLVAAGRHVGGLLPGAFLGAFADHMVAPVAAKVLPVAAV